MELGKSIARHATKNFTKVEDSYKKDKPTLQRIFIDNWDDFLEDPEVKRRTLRPIVIKEVERMMSCGTHECGFEIWECPTCQRYHVICYTCKSRFCATCGHKYAKQRAYNISEYTMNVNHRHMVLTIPIELHFYFRYDRNMLNLLFEACNNTIKYAFSKDFKSIPGIIMTLHTFGRSLNWNPHIHCLTTDGSMRGKQLFKHTNYIPYEVLRKSWQAQIIKLMREYIKENHPHMLKKFRRTSNQLFNKYKKGFYVYAPKAKNKFGKKAVINYIIRYTGRPVMASSRIISYNPKTKIVTYWYEDHETEEYIEVTEHVFEFMKKLIIHIPEEQFKLIRYYGLYATCDHKHKKKVKFIIKKHGRKWYDKLKNYRQDLIDTFNVDPFLCVCGDTLRFVEFCLPIMKGADQNGI